MIPVELSSLPYSQNKTPQDYTTVFFFYPYSSDKWDAWLKTSVYKPTPATRYLLTVVVNYYLSPMPSGHTNHSPTSLADLHSHKPIEESGESLIPQPHVVSEPDPGLEKLRLRLSLMLALRDWINHLEPALPCYPS